MSQPLPFSSVLTTARLVCQKKHHSRRAPLNRNCEGPFQEVIRHANDDWEMKVEGPEGFERSYTLAGGAGEHQPVAIGKLLLKLLPASRT